MFREIFGLRYFYKRWKDLPITQIKRLISYYRTKEKKWKEKMNEFERQLVERLPFESDYSIKLSALFQILEEKKEFSSSKEGK